MDSKPKLKLSNLVNVYKSIKKIGIKATFREWKSKFASIDDTETVIKRTLFFTLFMFLGSIVVFVWNVIIRNWAWLPFAFGLVGVMYYQLRTLYKGTIQFKLQKEALNPDNINAKMEELYKEGRELERESVVVKPEEVKEDVEICDANEDKMKEIKEWEDKNFAKCEGSIGTLPCIQEEK